MFVPISDDNPTLHTPWMTYVILALIAGAWVALQGAGLHQDAMAVSICHLGLIPAELTHMRPVGFEMEMTSRMVCRVDDEAINWLTPLTSMFLHGGWGHLLGNALFLWVFGNNIEDSMGPGRFLVFYLSCGLLAVVAHIATNASSPIPTVGASGAISGIMGAYLVLYPRARVNMLLVLVIFFRVFSVPAWLSLLWWFGVQVITALPELSPVRTGASGGVAVWAHIGGFVAGVALVKLFENPVLVAKRRLIHDVRYASVR